MIDCCCVCHDKVVFCIFGVLVNVLCDAVELNIDDYHLILFILAVFE